MGPDPKPRIERKDGRVLVVVPRGSAANAGWVWWPEGDDLVVGFIQPSDSDAIIAALDGKTPSAADHAILKDLARPEGSFVPLMTAILDPAAAPAEPKSKLTEFVRSAQIHNRPEPAGLPLGVRRRRAHERDPALCPGSAQAVAGGL